MKDHFLDPYTTTFPSDYYEYRYLYYPENTQAHPWLGIFLVGRMLGVEGREFTRWALEEFTAWGRVSYRKRDNSFVPMLTDGTSLEGYVWEEGPGRGTGENVIKPYPADLSFFWAYSTAYCATGDEFMWEMDRDIALGNGFGDIGQTPAHISKLQINTICSHAYGIFGFLELYAKTKKSVYLEMAQRIGDNILMNKFHKGFFTESKRHLYARFGCFEALALLHLYATVKSEIEVVPCAWPEVPLFIPPYRHKREGVDRHVIYSLTESSESPPSLQEAATIGDANLLRVIINKGTHVDSLEDSFYKTALHCAATEGHKTIIVLLLANGADINARDAYLASPLHYAVEKGHKQIAELLVVKGADVDAKNADGQTPLHCAATIGHKDIVELLIAKGADVNAKNYVGDTPLHYAAYSNHKDIVELLLEKGATISNIHSAAYMGDLAKLEDFFQEGVDINALDSRGYAPLHYAARNGRKEAVELLIAKGADVDVKNQRGQSPLDIAVRRGYKDIIGLLIAEGADINVKNKDGQTPVDVALIRNRSGVLKLLVEKGADVSLHVAASLGDVAKAMNCIEQGSDVNSKNQDELTPLHYATRRGHKGVVEVLLANGADVDVRDRTGQTPAERALLDGHSEIVELLVSNGADVYPLYLAISMRDLNKVRRLIRDGADVNKRTYGTTAIYIAAIAGFRDITELLIDKGADVNDGGSWDWTPLHGVAAEGHRELVELLIAKGANVNVRDGERRTPLWYAKDAGHTEIVELLRKHGAKE